MNSLKITQESYNEYIEYAVIVVSKYICQLSSNTVPILINCICRYKKVRTSAISRFCSESTPLKYFHIRNSDRINLHYCP